MRFAQLHNHTEYSILDGCGKVVGYVEAAAEKELYGLAITDHGNIDGAIKFQKACKANGIKPVIGCELYVVDDIADKKATRHHVVVWVQNEQGFRNLLWLLTYGHTKGFYRRPRVDWRTFVEHCRGLIVSTACVASFLNHKEGEAWLNQVCDRLPGGVFVEIMPHNQEGQKRLNQKAVELAKRYRLPLVATNDCHYIHADDEQAQEVLLAIQRRAKWKDENRFRFTYTGLYLRSEDEMVAAFEEQGGIPKEVYLRALSNTQIVVDKCADFEIKQRSVHLPPVKRFADARTDFEVLEGLCRDGLRQKKLWRDEYIKQLQAELGVIKEKDFARYFLIVYDLVLWCKENGILVGPGRGSVGGCLVAYAIGITQIDPLKFGLSFDRFINRDRIDLPDIDLDFMDVRRDEVRAHLAELYGHNHVAGVTTFGQMKNRGIVRDVARVFELPYKDVDEFAKALDDSDDLEAVFAEREDGQAFAAKYPAEVRLMVKLCGQVKSYGRHAAAVIVSKDDLTEGTRANLAIRDGEQVINWDKNDAEYMGLMKLDILGLSTLSVIDEALRLIEERHGVKMTLADIPLEDVKVLELINSGKTAGLFQIQTRPMRKLIEQMGVERFSHISDAIALVRPGPFQSGMTDEYIRRKHGGKWKPLHPIYEEITADTYGVIVYQEQIMQVVNRVAGLPYSTADKIRKIIGKKRDVAEFKPYHDAFVNGCVQMGTLTKQQAEDFWEGLEKHASYSFNKAHSVAYAMLGVYTGWLKAYYPEEFICASLTYGAKNQAERQGLIDDAKAMGLVVVPPKIGLSDGLRWQASDGKLYMPFIEVKGIGEKTAEQFAKTRQKKKTGFFRLNKTGKVAGRAGAILADIKAYDVTTLDVPSEYFDIDLGNNIAQRYPKLVQMLDDTDVLQKVPLSDVLQGNFSGVALAREAGKPSLRGLKVCKQCSLSKEAPYVVPPSYGEANIAIIGEAPGKDEKDKGFVGRAGKLLWKELGKYGLERDLFYVTNVCHCWPRKSKTPKPGQVKRCVDTWLRRELASVKPFVVLALGNVPLLALTGKEGGIIKQTRDKTIEWCEDWGFWVVWSVHPASVLRDGSKKELLSNAVKTFSDFIEKVGGI